MYTVKGDGILIYSDVSNTESRKASSPTLARKDNSAGSLVITLPPGNAGYDALQRMKSELVVYRDNKAEWYGRIISESMDFWNNRILTCEGELAYLNDTTQPQHKYPEGTTVLEFLEAVLSEHNKRYDDERYRFHVDINKSRIYNYDETLPEIVTDFENTLECIMTNVVNKFECHIRIERVDGVKYIGFIKEEAEFNESTQTIRFGENLLDFTKNWDLTEMATVIIPRGAVLETESDEDSDAFDTYVSLKDIPKDDVPKRAEIGEYLRYTKDDVVPPDFKVGDLKREVDENGELTGQLVYEYPIIEGEYEYKKDFDGYIVLEWEDEDETKPSIRVNTNETDDDRILVEFLESGEIVSKIYTDGNYADVYLKNQNGDFYSLKDEYGWIEQVVDFSEAKTSVDLIKNVRDYIKEHRFDEMELEVSAVDMRYLMDSAEPVEMLDRIRCISFPHGMNTLFTITELTIQLDKPDSARYTLTKTATYSPSSATTLSGAMSAVASDMESTQSSILIQAKSNADKILREKTNGYVSLVTDTAGGRHSEALVISSGRDYRKSSHFWVWNANGLGHYTENGDGYAISVDDDDVLSEWLERYTLNAAITMDGAIVANRITVGHMSADRVRTGVLMSQDGNVVWNLNKNDTYVSETHQSYEGGSLMIKKGSIALGETFGKWPGAFSVNSDGELHAEKGNIGGFTITDKDIHNDSTTLDGVGIHLTAENVNLGFVGTTQDTDFPSKKFLTMALENDAAGIAWGYREYSTDVTDDGTPKFTAKLMYISRKGITGLSGDTLYAYCDLDMDGYRLLNCKIDTTRSFVDGGSNYGTAYLLGSGAINDDGTVRESQLVKVRIKNGFIMSS